MKVFITGASGFIGRALAERCRARGDEVVGCDLVADRERGVVAGDVAERGAWQECAHGCDLLIHTAATVSLRLERPNEVWRANVLGTAHALEAAERAGVGRFVHFSSVTVFGFDFPDGVDERYPVHLTGLPYPDTKIAAEQVVLQAHLDGRVQAALVRPGDVYGPGSRAWALLPAELIRDRRFVLPAGGRGIFSPVYIDNLVDGVLTAAEHPAAVGQIFTLTDGVGITNREFFTPYAQLVGRRLLTMPAPAARLMAGAVQAVARLTPGDNEINPRSLRYMARKGTYSNAKARTVLGWEPRVGLTEGQGRTMAWLRERGFGAA